MNKELQKLNTWLTANKLSLNISKLTISVGVKYSCPSTQVHQVPQTYTKYKYWSSTHFFKKKYLSTSSTFISSTSTHIKICSEVRNIPPRTHNNLVSNITDNIDTIIETRMVQFIFNSINHSNSTCKNVLRVKLLSVNSTFAANYQYFSFQVWSN